MKFSIIIPIYFYNNYVEGMFESIVSLEYVSCEIIVIGNSISKEEFFSHQKSILLKFKNSRFNLKFILADKPGANYARTLGLNESSSDYVFFMDSDDQFTERNILTKTENIINQYGPDVITFNLQHALLEENKIQPLSVVYTYKNADRLLTYEKDFKVITQNYGTNIVARFIRRELITDLIFLDLPYCQDWNASSKVYFRVKSFYFVNSPGYYWVNRKDSISKNSTMNLAKHLKSFDSITDIIEFYEANNPTNKQNYFLYDRIIKFCFQYIARSSFFELKEGIQRSNLLLNRKVPSFYFITNRKILIMYLLIKIKPLLRLYFFVKPVK